MARLRLSLALSFLALGATGCGSDRDDGPSPPRPDAVPLGVAELDALCAKARCQRVVITDSVTVALHGGDQPRTLTVTAHPILGDPHHIDLTLAVFEGGVPATRGGPWSIPDGGSAWVSVPWGGGVRVEAKNLEGDHIRLLITEGDDQAAP